MIHTRTKIIALISIGFLLLSLCVYLGFFWMVNGHKEQLQEERVRAAEAEVQARALKALEETVTHSEADRAKLKTYILEDEEIIDTLSLIEKTALEQGVVLTTKNLNTVPIDDVFEDLQVTVNIDGSFDGVLRMIRILEQIPQQSSIPNVSLIKTGELKSTWEAQLDIHITKFKKV